MAERKESVRVSASGEDFKREFRTFTREAAELNAALRLIPNRVTVKAEARGLDDVEQQARRAERGSSALADTLVALGPAAVPIGAVVVPALAGMAAQLGFVAAAGGTALLAFNGVGDALKALDAYQLEPTAANMGKLNQAMQKLGPAGRDFVRELDSLEPALKAIKTSAESGIFPGLTAGLDSLSTRLPQVRAIVAEISKVTGNLGAEAGSSLAGGGFDKFFDYLQNNARPILEDLGRTIGNITKGFANLFVATAPAQREFSTWLLGVARGFEQWVDGLGGSDGFGDFMDYLHETGPAVADALKSISEAIIAVTKAAAPLGGPTLQILSTLADVITRIADSPVGTPLIALASSLALLNRALAFRAFARDSLVADLIGGRTAGIDRARGSIRSLTSDLRVANSLGAFAGTKALASPAQLEAQAAAAGRVSSRLTSLAKGTAVVGGLAFATSGLADKMGLANTASYALLGTIAGPWGAAIGGGIGLVKDLAAANDDLTTSVERSNRLLGSDNTSSQVAAQRRVLNQQIRETESDVHSSNPFKGVPAAFSIYFGQVNKAKGVSRDLRDQLENDGARGSRAASGLGSVLTEGMGSGLRNVAAEFDSATTSSERFYGSLQKFNERLDLRASLRAQAQALIDFQKLLKEKPKGTGGKQGDLDREAGLDAYARSALQAANLTKDVVTQTRRLGESRKVFIGMAEDLGRTPAQARKLADSLGLVDRRASQAGNSGKNAGRKVAGGLNSAKTSAQQADGAVRGFGKYYNSLAGKNVKPKVTLDNKASPILTLIAHQLAAIKDKNVTVTTNYVNRTAPGKRPVSQGTQGGTTAGGGKGRYSSPQEYANSGVSNRAMVSVQSAPLPPIAVNIGTDLNGQITATAEYIVDRTLAGRDSMTTAASVAAGPSIPGGWD